MIKHWRISVIYSSWCCLFHDSRRPACLIENLCTGCVELTILSANAEPLIPSQLYQEFQNYLSFVTPTSVKFADESISRYLTDKKSNFTA